MGYIDKLVNTEGFGRFRRTCVTFGCVITAVALVLKYLLDNREFGSTLLVTGLGVLSLFAFLLAYRKPKHIEFEPSLMSPAQRLFTSKGLANFMCKLDGYGTSLGLIGLLFKLNNWPGGTKMLYLVVPTLLIVGILHLVKYLLTRDLRPINYKE